MKERHGLKKEARKHNAAAAATLALALAGNALAGQAAYAATANAGEKEKQVATTQSKFFCNIKALTPEERAQHEELTKKLEAAGRAIVETEKGYEFQFSPANVSIGELARWVAMESKCCPFFDFHIDLEKEGDLLCLRLTGEEGVKAFIRSEFSGAWNNQRQ